MHQEIEILYYPWFRLAGDGDHLYSKTSPFSSILTMTDPFVYSEVDRTKSRWVAKVFQEFGRPRTTLRALFYYALSRAESDYPICGGFVGEIRITRPYHESDGEKLAKWAGKAQKLGFLPADALLKEEPGEHTFLPETRHYRTHRLELWLNRSDFNSLAGAGMQQTRSRAGLHRGTVPEFVAAAF